MEDIDGLGLGESLDESWQLVRDTVLSFFLGGLFLAVAICTDSHLVGVLGWILAALLISAGWGRPVRQRRAHRIKLWLGGIACVYAGAAARLFFEAHGFLQRVVIVASAVISLVVGFFTLLSRQGQVWRELSTGFTEPRQKSISKALAIISMVFLFLAVFGCWPSGFYTLHRFAVCGSSIYLAVQANELGKRAWIWIMGAMAVLFNPLIPVRLPRSDWQAMDFIAAVVFAISLVAFRKRG